MATNSIKNGEIRELVQLMVPLKYNFGGIYRPEEINLISVGSYPKAFIIRQKDCFSALYFDSNKQAEYFNPLANPPPTPIFIFICKMSVTAKYNKTICQNNPAKCTIHHCISYLNQRMENIPDWIVKLGLNDYSADIYIMDRKIGSLCMN